MKKLFILAAIPLLMLACGKTKEKPQTGEGKIVLSAEMDSKVDGEYLNTRASALGYAYSITGDNDYTDSGVLGSEPISKDVKAGEYTVDIISETGTFVPAFDEPVYGATMTKEVASNSIARFEMICKQLNVGIQYIFDGSLSESYPNLKVTMTASDGSLDYTKANEGTNIAYFNPGNVRITLTNGGTPVKINNKDYYDITGIARQLWTITLKTSGESSSIVISVEVDTDTDDENWEIGIGDVEGAGTLVLPYTVNDAINILPAQEVWIEGVIVGSANLVRSTQYADNIIIGNIESNGAGSSVIIELEEGSPIKAALNLEDNPGNLGKILVIKGDVVGGALGSTSASIVNVTECNVGVLRDVTFPVGTAIRFEYFTDSLYERAIKRNFNSMTAENAMKLARYATSENTENWDWAMLDEYVQFAEDNNMRIHGHTPIWYRDIPQWIRDFQGNRDEWIALMQKCIKTTIGRYRGRIASWDVVNEAFNKDGTFYTGASDAEPNIWNIKIGDDYITYAFEAAREADPNCKLFYNDNVLVWPDTNRDAIFSKLAALKTAGLIDGLGIQMHIDKWYAAASDGLVYGRTAEVFQKANALGLLVHISELDIRMNPDKDQSSFSPELDAFQAGCYNTIFSKYAELVPADKQWGITIWGLTDKYTYINDDFPGHPQWPLLFDADYSPKRAYFEIIKNFSAK